METIRDARHEDAEFLAKCIMAGMSQLVRLYESVGFVPAGHLHAFGVDFQRMIYTAHSRLCGLLCRSG